ncbi:copper amine oxidase [Actinomadura soli]|uniref:copper amine oxidase n=1 Tax=Actinomadura soli TaxID=2508997 RepID=UPI00197A90E8
MHPRGLTPAAREGEDRYDRHSAAVPRRIEDLAAVVRPLEDQDLVLRRALGSTHVPRTEDWPVMPVEYAASALEPVGFFDRHPALDLPATSGEASAHTNAHGDPLDLT